jgi:nucleotide-binding universal stress UspA family protein
MYRRIMVPLDGSEQAEQALGVAAQLAHLYGRPAALGSVFIHLVRVVDPMPVLPWGPYPFGMLSVPDAALEVPEAVLEEDTAVVGAYLARVQRRLSAHGLQARVSLLTGSVVAALLAYEHSERIDLVVMTSQWRIGLARLALGSMAEALLRRGKAPVLIVPPSGDAPRLDQAIVPLDGSPDAERALLVLRELSLNVVREATLLRVIDSPEQYLPAMRYLSRLAMQPELGRLILRRRVVEGDPVQTIRELGSRKLLVLTKHLHSLRVHRGSSSVVDGVAHNAMGATVLAPYHASHHVDRGRWNEQISPLERGSR